ncbi:helix-turn-helix domain-containing protein [Clostridium algidicarnis]|uniref:PucR family transcriptional regulator n=1 Tax=Clostridium algidicarnis TaxID=37659 RepID=UPI00162775D2|nr:helix-turn-helix domain-containing protein [Clostridium algidicarnis]MBB6630064.1 helix-turn-helix domain-containing protein [Clostridium algidicarnis]MBU3196962.1 helix-turn-helix domain-containing protein [Clostridium algidicarnis]MBU3204637.1 helix-turn-helix domain-containing protein [Clostridium algidicarnis]MBU3206591.1 helix-turn-helix domain-containing protein [Clostridium algidicarnis]MBU3212878.1 helix-turn-helix domain-containing protein [Clostridium algidicarnis]
MYNFQTFLKELSLNSSIPFMLTWMDGKVIYEKEDSSSDKDLVETVIELGRQKATLMVSKRYEMCTPLLKYYIENKYSELFSIRDQVLSDVLEGKPFLEERVERHFPFLLKGFNLMVISVEGSKYEALNIIMQMYIEDDIASLIFGETIVLIGIFEDIKEHAESIREAIISNLYCRCYISYSSIKYELKDILEGYKSAKDAITIGKKFGIKGEIYDFSNMDFEKVVYNISDSLKHEFIKRFKDKFESFDSEMLNTVEEFIKSDLNISDAAKKLYIHRNTLIYRLDKIYKDTGYDIRSFKDATIFMIAFLMWKEGI